MSMLENALAQVDELRAALERERERSAAYADSMEKSGKKMEELWHIRRDLEAKIKALGAQTQWEPVEDGAQVQMENFYWEYDAGEVSKWDYETGHPYDQMDLPAEWCLMRRTYAAPAAEEAQRWEPVEDGYTYTDENDDTITVSDGGSLLYIRDDNSWVKLPANVRLCRRVDAAPGAVRWHRTAEHMPPSDETVLGYWSFEDDVDAWPICETCVYYTGDGPGKWLSGGSDLGAPDYWQRLTSPLDAAPGAAKDGAQ